MAELTNYGKKLIQQRRADPPSADEWLAAVLHVHDQYPEDVFPPTSTSPDAQAGTWARKVCENIMLEAYRRHQAALIDGSPEL